MAQTFFVWFSQIALCIIMTIEIFKQGVETIALYPSNYCVIISRFVCSIVLHMQQQNKLRLGLQKMKFAINHSYKFKPGLGYAVAFISGFMQTTMIMCVEIVNIFSILQYQDTMNVVIIFLALAIVSDFDSFFYEALGDNKDKDLIENEGNKYDELLYTVRRTSSAAAKSKIDENKLEDPAWDFLKEHYS